MNQAVHENTRLALLGRISMTSAMWRYPDPNTYTGPHAHAQRALASEMPRHMYEYTSQGQGCYAPAHAPAHALQQQRRRRGPPQPPPPDPARDANAFIDAICGLSASESSHLEWLLDLEFGPPHSRPPAHRHIAYYDVHRRIVMSASQPNTVHPDFLRCNEWFRALLVEHLARREAADAAGGYRELYRAMDEQRHLAGALAAASARHAYPR